ncbi:DNA replication ATP-dependent helicase/nuclease DNA2 [Ceratina calcarata]|uniref:DNA replication ATP-dependent helicase/nuclease DNA2 n=1 Tax=Ceratina calcarata TaxID=156304 RepID=A0AAJ7S248_9HYME|nr:DNA replication ATP-dependent helicase/nuclease DNA2 [Ceratina calcarata]
MNKSRSTRDKTKGASTSRSPRNKGKNNIPKDDSKTISKTDIETQGSSVKRKLLETDDSCQRKIAKLGNGSPRTPKYRPSLADKNQLNNEEDGVKIVKEVIVREAFSKENMNPDQSKILPRKSSGGNVERVSFEKCISGDEGISDVSIITLNSSENSTFDKHPSISIDISTDASDKSIIIVNDSDESLREISTSSLPKDTTESQNSIATGTCDTKTINESQELEKLFDDFLDEEFLNISEVDFDSSTYKVGEIDFGTFQRCKVVEIKYEANTITLDVEQKNEKCGTVLICGRWVNCIVRKGDKVVVRAEKKGGKWTVDDVTGMLVVHPDTLLSGTSISGATFCMRKSVLSEKFRRIDSLRSEDQDSTPLVVGTLVHQLLQTAINKNISRTSEISELMEKILQTPDAVTLLYATNVTLRTCREKMSIYVPKIQEFILHYLKDQEQNQIARTTGNFKGKIAQIRDIEEIVWSPELGMKGKIDITAQVKINSKKKIMPLEIKTGRATFSHQHRGQVILYLMMMALTEEDTDTGLLLYLKDVLLREVKSQRAEERDLIILRNTLAHYLTASRFDSSKETLENLELPEPINSPWCSSCEYNTLCCAYLSRDDSLQLSESHPLKQVTNQILKTLKPEHIDYMLHWVKLLQMEESVHSSESTFKQLWTLTPQEREKKGRAVCNLKMLDVRVTNGRYVHSFARASPGEKIPYLEFNDNEYVIISTNARINLASGYVAERGEDQINVMVDRDLIKYKHEIFHVNKYSSSSYLSTNLGNIGELMTNTEICRRLREIVIEKKPATFDENSSLAGQLDNTGLMQRFNKGQLVAIKKALSANDYLLIKGMPGTGKTETIVGLIMSLRKMKLSVLITAHTNSAVDNILLKLLEMGVDFLRLGSSAHSSLTNKTDAYVTSNCTSPESLEKLYSSKDIVATTCYGASHPLLKRRTFDFCLVDESTQALQSTVLRPLYSAKKFVLVGDPDQLPPIVRNIRAKKLGADESLFSRLDNENNTVELNLQYRMNRRIMHVANKFTYRDMLKSGDVATADACISTQQSILKREKEWTRKALSPLISESVILINTGRTCNLKKPSEMADRFSDSEDTCSNVWEAAIAAKLVQTLLMMGISIQNIGIITPYRAQVDLLGRVIRQAVEINTVDQYQGRDKDIIIYSCVKSLLDSDIIEEDNEILGDRRRLTVAITRAKKKLIIIADKHTTSRYSTFDDLYKIINETDDGRNVINLTDHIDLSAGQQLIDTDNTGLMQRFNKGQLVAIKKALSANDYLLIKGMPGTGKTETIVGLIMSLRKMKLSVLITAHTNSAVDNILLKLLEMGVDFLRLGSSAHSSLTNKTDAYVTSNCTSPESLEKLYSSKDIVATTCYGASHPLLKRRTFDFCLVDESTQALQSTVLRPLYSAKKFVLVGDPDQLPPIVRNIRAKKLGADESLFSRLDNENNTVELNLQYRMNRRIMHVANKFTYRDMLKSGDVATADACISTQQSILKREKEWTRKALSPLISESVILINTGRTCNLKKPSEMADRFSDSEDTCSNVWEAAIAAKLVQTLLMMGISIQNIGIITPYRAQVDLLGRVIRQAVEINTVDQYQGRDKDIIIYSCVKSLLDSDIIEEDNEILGDRRRLTVAITRAKKKLIIIADKHTTSRYSTFDDLYKIINETDDGRNVINLTDHIDLSAGQQLIDIL